MAAILLLAYFPPVLFIVLVTNRKSDKNPQTQRLTIAQEMALLMDRSDGVEVPAVLFYLGDNEGSAITLKGTEGGKLALTPEHLPDY